MRSLADLQIDLNRASNELQRLAGTNGPYGSRVTAEINYGAAYQALVRTGHAPQIRRKYRG